MQIFTVVIRTAVTKQSVKAHGPLVNVEDDHGKLTVEAYIEIPIISKRDLSDSETDKTVLGLYGKFEYVREII